ncbi:hypothetical protein ACIHCQ_42225 [Streptomyces sp. NPDC052236]|uniref:hypothetical protein n=1 Tax=Streptomyces sp. NPDC052236 TaxID=3365686 RepID=UPI0037CE492C
MAALPPRRHAGRELLTGTGRVTLARTGGAAPGWGAYALLYTTRLLDGRLEAVIAATRPADTDPAWDLHHPRPYGPKHDETRPLRNWAAATNPPQAKTENAAAYNERLALFLLRVGFAARLVPPPAGVDLPLAQWEVQVEGAITLTPVKGGTHGFASHSVVRIGRLITVTAKEG